MIIHPIINHFNIIPMKSEKKIKLNLSKKVISNFQASKISGGTTMDTLPDSNRNHCMHTCTTDCDPGHTFTHDSSSICMCT